MGGRWESQQLLTQQRWAGPSVYNNSKSPGDEDAAGPGTLRVTGQNGAATRVPSKFLPPWAHCRWVRSSVSLFL